MVGHIALVLHAHLPYVRHPENEIHLEEMWLFEALSECYIPLITTLDRLAKDNARAHLTISLSPPLMAMLDDPLLKERYLAHLQRTLLLCKHEVHRTRQFPKLQSLAFMYQRRYENIQKTYLERCNQDIINSFLQHHEKGHCELITAAGTHGILPLMQTRHVQRAHIQSAVQAFKQRLGFAPRGMWLPECAFTPGLEELLAAAGIEYTVVDHHAFMLASTQPQSAGYAPITSPPGVSFFARDPESSEAVWSATKGYPGDPNYRDFYRDIGFDLPIKDLLPVAHPDELRVQTGLKYHRITSHNNEPKALYHPIQAHGKALQHAKDFVRKRAQQIAQLNPTPPLPPIIVCPYDAELFGHWWFEGPTFLEAVLRELNTHPTLNSVTLSEALSAHPSQQVSIPNASSWGEGGGFSVWLNESNDWIYRHLHRAEERMVSLANYYPEARGARLRALNQAARELMLAQSSDWAFIIKANTNVEYAVKRLRGHLERFNLLDQMLEGDQIDEELLTLWESTANIFPNMNYTLFEGPLLSSRRF